MAIKFRSTPSNVILFTLGRTYGFIPSSWCGGEGGNPTPGFLLWCNISKTFYLFKISPEFTLSITVCQIKRLGSHVRANENLSKNKMVDEKHTTKIESHFVICLTFARQRKRKLNELSVSQVQLDGLVG